MFINEYTNILYFNIYINMYIYDRFSVETDNLFTYMYRMIVTKKYTKLGFRLK